ncbi:hypothetical protein [Sulfobacillus harzensis]|uniref:Flagellar FliJ protein n=1 Tax=Sulfobacillus harzensis TaxID=2729629 RepID=A0A7Y0Q416_9FIRM|nr:hypothetical protein [Sulfobacillus harzensis]NMP23551.1 hypothetical protein [Sulfobacillus harzensis]
MISVLIDLAGQERDRLRHELASLVEEQRLIAQQREHWHLSMTRAPETMASGGDIAQWLAFGARADKQLQILEEKDFVVETRISECREALIRVIRRIETLETIMERREQERLKTLQRREVRGLSQRGVARRAKEEAEREPWG